MKMSMKDFTNAKIRNATRTLQDLKKQRDQTGNRVGNLVKKHSKMMDLYRGSSGFTKAKLQMNIMEIEHIIRKLKLEVSCLMGEIEIQKDLLKSFTEW